MNPQDYNQNPYGGGQNPQNFPPQNGNFQGAQNFGEANFSNQPAPQNFGQVNYPAQNFQNPNFPQNAPQNFENPQAFPQNGFSNQPFSQNPNQPSTVAGEQLPPVQQNPNAVSQSTLQSQNPYTIEYLNQIAPKEAESFWTKGKIMLLAFIAIGGILAIFALLFSNRQTTPTQALTELYYHIQQSKEISQKYQKKLQGSDIAAVNAGLATSLSSDETELKKYMTSKKVEIPKSKEQQKKSEAYKKVSKEYEKLDEVLNDAFLNTTIDDVYAREMAYQLSLVRASAQKLKSKTDSKSGKDALEALAKNLDVAISKLKNT